MSAGAGPFASVPVGDLQSSEHDFIDESDDYVEDAADLHSYPGYGDRTYGHAISDDDHK
ncbi:hypothetical protein DSM104299_05087 [Baekduia alba]|uniref:hypothetical protein n=1 Tax=Baekduia alba TaxID=2997333 RepID=UPI0023425E05|nr:hypothetical protein [Baekduia alba]WCB96330.1 hypothetical protein DSM104299_05087 [Baekduia alba]